MDGGGIEANAESMIKVKALLKQNKIQTAIKALQLMLDEERQHSDVYYLLGECYRQTHEHAKAVECLAGALRFE